VGGRVTLLDLVRHAHAGDPERWSGPDAARPLSDKGRRQADRLGRYLQRLGDKPEIVISSPKVRALQTAEIVAGVVGIPVTTDPRLGEPLDLEVVDSVLTDAGDPERPLLVGHDPDFSELLGMLVGAGTLQMRKGAFARVEVDRPLEYGRGRLRVLLPPELLPST